MGATKQHTEVKSPTAAWTGVYDRYDRSLEILTCRALGEPYNFFRIEHELCEPMFGGGVFGKVLEVCQRQFKKDGRFSVQTVAIESGIPPETLSEFSMRHAEMDLPFAFDAFRDTYGQFVEIQIAELVAGWIMQGKTSEEIIIEAEKMRRAKGVRGRSTGTDGVAEFEAELLAAIDGKVFDFPVKPHLPKMRSLTPHYEPGDYIVVAALSGIGKTYYGLNTVYFNALRGVPCCCINLENTPKNILKRIWQMHGGNRFHRDLSGDDRQGIAHLQAWEDVKKLPLRSHNPGPTLPAILSTIRFEYNERGIQFALIDYAQLISIPGYHGGRNYELGEISAAFRALALELNIPIMVLAQLKQEVVKYADRRGGLYDIKDCANFAQDATFVQILHRPSEVEKEGEFSELPEDYADVTTVKGRETGRAKAECRFNPILGFFEETATSSNQFPIKHTNGLPAFDRNENLPF